MSNYWNTRTKNIIPYTPGEQPKDRKFIKLNTNENPYPPSPKVIEAIKAAADADLRLYPDPESTVFREAASRHYGVKPEQVFAGNGSDEILAFAFAAFFESGCLCKGNCDSDDCGCDKSNCGNCPYGKAKPILFPDITYSFYPVYADLWNIPYNKIPVCDDFSINCDDCKIPSGGVIFPNPNAPTGIPVPLDDILSLAKYLMESGDKGVGSRVLIVDEAYVVFGAESAVPHIEKYPNLLTVHTLSKQMSLAGLRFGFAIGSEELIEGLYRIKDSFNSYPIDRLALAGATVAINDSAYYEKINAKVTATREKTANVLCSLGFNVLPSAANFLFVKAPNLSGSEFFSKLRERGILVRHFYKDRIADFLRISIGTDGEMDVLINACKNLNVE